jgi:hypothetical protein
VPYGDRQARKTLPAFFPLNLTRFPSTHACQIRVEIVSTHSTHTASRGKKPLKQQLIKLAIAECRHCHPLTHLMTLSPPVISFQTNHSFSSGGEVVMPPVTTYGGAWPAVTGGWIAYPSTRFCATYAHRCLDSQSSCFSFFCRSSVVGHELVHS